MGTGRSRASAAALALVLGIGSAACGGAPAPSATGATGPCAPDLPARTSPTDFPVAVLHVNGDDVPPVIGPVDWTDANGNEVVHEPELPAHLERFTVLQTRNQTDVSVRLTDGAEIEAWTIDVVPANTFRIGDLELDRRRWSEGDEPTSLVCVPVEDGSWAVIGDITYADDAGSATFYWRLNVIDTPEA